MGSVNKVLIANRGEIAVRAARAAQDDGVRSVGVYAEPDRNARHVKVADEAYTLGDCSAREAYLDAGKLLDIANQSGVDAVYPGYGFLAEDVDFAQAVLDAGLTWIGPPPIVISKLSSNFDVSQIATGDGVSIFSNVRGRFSDAGEQSFDKRFLGKSRHIETQCIADSYGKIAVVSTRDCSLQREGQILVAEAPAPFLTDEQCDELVRVSKDILLEVGYVGVGSCEFLIGADGVINFLKVGMSIKAEHPVSEEVTGLDLVREQFRIARGENLGYDDPIVHGHSIEFQITGEDAGRNFLSVPGTVRAFRIPSGPGVRVDSGVVSGDIVCRYYDAMLAKLIVTGHTRREALERSSRALAEFYIDGVPTVLPFHRAVVEDIAFADACERKFSVHTRWIDTEFDNQIPSFGSFSEVDTEQAPRQIIVIEVNGEPFEISLPVHLVSLFKGSRSLPSPPPRNII